MQADPRPQAVHLEAVGERLQQRERLVWLIAREQHPRQRDGGVRPARLEGKRRAQRLLVARGRQQLGLAGCQVVEELFDGRARLRSDELLDHHSVAEGLDCRNPLDAERLRQARIGVRVDLGQYHRALACRRGLLQQRRKRPARATPRGPEVDHHRCRARALEHLDVEVQLADIHNRHPRSL